MVDSAAGYGAADSEIFAGSAAVGTGPAGDSERSAVVADGAPEDKPCLGGTANRSSFRIDRKASCIVVGEEMQDAGHGRIEGAPVFPTLVQNGFALADEM